MARSPRGAARRLLATSTTALLVSAGLALPLAGTALANVTTIDAEPETQRVQLGQPASFTGEYVSDGLGATSTEDIRVLFLSGSRAGTYGDPTDEDELLGDGTFTYSYTPTAAGTDVLRFFGDNNRNGVYNTGEPIDDVTVTVAGAAAAVNLSPDSSSAAVGACDAYTVSSSDSSGQANPRQRIVIDITQPTSTGSGPANVAFCDPNGSAPNADPATQTPSYNPNTGATPSSTRRLVVTTGSNGEPVVFGVQSTQPGTMTITAFADSNNNNVRDGAEPQDSSTETFTNNGSDAVATVDAEPETGRGFKGEPVSFTVKVNNAGGNPVPAVTVSVKITGANPGQFNCPPTDNNGQTTCTYTPANAGRDTIVAYVNNTSSTTGGPDPSEPQDEITRDISDFSSSTLTVTMTCQGSSANTGSKACVLPTDDPTDVLTAVVTAPDGSDADTLRDPVGGVIVRFTVSATGPNSTDDDSKVNPVDVPTDSNGRASTTLTNPNPVNNDSATVTVSIPNQKDTDSLMPGTQTSSDSTTTTWKTRTASKIDLKPDVLTAERGSTNTFTATVTDQFGSPAVGQNVDFVVENTPATTDVDRTGNNQTSFDHVTGPDGKASFGFTDVGPSNTGGSNQVRAWVDNVTENDTQDTGEPTDSSTVNYITQTTTVNKVDIDVDGTCNPTTASPGTDQNDTRTVTFDSRPEDDRYGVCALAVNQFDTPIAGHLMTFSITGVGNFVNSDGSDGGKTTTAYTDGSGIARVEVRSQGEAGDQVITATLDNGSDTGTITYKAAPAQARVIDLTPETRTVDTGTEVELTALVTDRFNNPVAGVTVTFSEDGEGGFVSGTSPQTATTDAEGKARAKVTSTTPGTDTVKAALSPASTDCELAADDPSGARAGVCEDTATITFARKDLRITAPTNDSRVIGGTRVVLSGDGCEDVPNTDIDVTIHEKYAGDTSYHQLSGGAVCTGGAWSYTRRINTTSYIYVSGSNGSTPSIKINAFRTVSPGNGTTVRPGTRIYYRGAGGVPGELVTIYERLGGQTSYTQLKGGATVGADGRWLYRRYVSRATYVYFRGEAGNTPSVQVLVAR